MTTQTNKANQFYVRLVSHTKLEKPSVVSFYNTVKANLPSGVLSSYQVERPGYGLDTVRLTHKTGEAGSQVYDIPLTRNLTEKEFQAVRVAFADLAVEGQRLETSAPTIANARQLLDGEPQIEPDKFEVFCDTLAKHQHSNWCTERTEAGWRFGFDHNAMEKTSPLLRPWHDLPAQYKSIDKKLPSQILNILEDLGYVIVPKAELEKLKKKK